MHRVYLPARFIWRVFLPVLQEIWKTPAHLHIRAPDLFLPVRKAAGECIYEYTLRGWANEICLPRLLCIFLCTRTSVSVERKFVLILIKESDFKNISCWESVFSRMTSNGLKNRTLNLSRMTCPEYLIHSCTSWFSRHADTAKQIVSYSWLVIIFYRHECSCYWMC